MIDVMKKVRKVTGLTVEELAHQIGVTRVALYKWTQVPEARCARIHELCKGQVSLQEMRPDIYA